MDAMLAIFAVLAAIYLLSLLGSTESQARQWWPLLPPKRSRDVRR